MQVKDIKSLIAQMPLSRKIGQLCVPILESDEITPEIASCIRDYGAGMIRYCPIAVFDNKSCVIGEPNRFFTSAETAEFTNKLQSISAENPLNIPLFIAVDQEGSCRNDMVRDGAFAYPGHMAFGAADDMDLTYKVALAAGRELRAMGINVVQAPIVDVLRYEGRQTMKAATFGEDAVIVAAHAAAMMKGFTDAGILSMSKHFPGYGSVATDAHKGAAEIFKAFDDFEAEDVYPLRKLIKDGLGAVMTGHAILHCIDPKLPATLSPKVIGYLRETLGFDGIVETDAMRMPAVAGKYGVGKASVMAVKAGCDLVLLRGSFAHFKEGYDALLNAAESGGLPLEIIDAALTRILTQKARIGLFNKALSNPDEARKTVGCAEHKSLMKELAERSVYVSRQKIMPLKPCKIAVVWAPPQKIEAAMDEEQPTDMLHRAVKKYNADTVSIQVSRTPGADGIAAAVNSAKDADIIVFGSFNAIIYKEQAKLAKALHNENKYIIAVSTDSPYDLEEYPFIADNIITFGVSAKSMDVAAQVMFGLAEGRGNPPVTLSFKAERE
jgi:beta-N-acetylhexosaminidase